MKNRDYITILYEDYPEIHELWAIAVNADFEAMALYEDGKLEESEVMSKKHKDYWEQYLVASKLVLTGHEDLE